MKLSLAFWRRAVDPMHEVDDLRADLRRVEAENERLSAAILDCRNELNRANLRIFELDAKNARQARLLMDASVEIDGLEAAEMKWVSVDAESPPDNTPVALWDQSKRSQIISECLWIAWEDWTEAGTVTEKFSHWMKIEPPSSSVGSVQYKSLRACWASSSDFANADAAGHQPFDAVQ